MVTVGVVHTLVSTGIIKVVEDGYQDIQYIAALQDIEQELLQHKMAMAQWSSYTYNCSTHQIINTSSFMNLPLLYQAVSFPSLTLSPSLFPHLILCLIIV